MSAYNQIQEELAESKSEVAKLKSFLIDSAQSTAEMEEEIRASTQNNSGKTSPVILHDYLLITYF